MSDRNERKLKERWAKEFDPDAWLMPDTYEKGVRRVAARDRAMDKIIATREKSK